MDLHKIKFTGKHAADYADRHEVYPGSPLMPEDDDRGRFIEVEHFKTFTLLALNDAALADLIEDCAYYVECVGGDGEHGMAASAKAVLRQLVKLGYQDWTIRYTEGYRVTL